MADPALIKIAAEAAIQVAKDEESRKRLLAIILAPTIFLLILIAFILYLVTSPLSMLTGWLVGDEISVVEEFQRDYGFNQSRKQFIGAGAGGCTFFWKTCGGNHGKGTF